MNVFNSDTGYLADKALSLMDFDPDLNFWRYFIIPPPIFLGLPTLLPYVPGPFGILPPFVI